MDEKENRARWVQNSPRTWILKCRVRDGGDVLAAICDFSDGPSGGYGWRLGSGVPGRDRLGEWEWTPRFYTAQRRVRAALADARAAVAQARGGEDS